MLLLLFLLRRYAAERASRCYMLQLLMALCHCCCTFLGAASAAIHKCCTAGTWLSSDQHDHKCCLSRIFSLCAIHRRMQQQNGLQRRAQQAACGTTGFVSTFHVSYMVSGLMLQISLCECIMFGCRHGSKPWAAGRDRLCLTVSGQALWCSLHGLRQVLVLAGLVALGGRCLQVSVW